MRVSVDRRLCAGHGLCAKIAPTVFRVNDAWMADVLMEAPPESLREAVENAARFCPVNAVKIESTPSTDPTVMTQL